MAADIRLFLNSSDMIPPDIAPIPPHAAAALDRVAAAFCVLGRILHGFAPCVPRTKYALKALKICGIMRLTMRWGFVIVRQSTSQEAHMTDQQTNQLTNARAILAAALTIVEPNVTGDSRALADMLAVLLDKACDDLRQVAEAA